MAIGIIKRVLGRFGNALVNSVHERLTGVELRLDDTGIKVDRILQQSYFTAENLALQYRSLTAQSQALAGLAAQNQDLADQNRGLAAQSRDLAAQNRELAAQSRDLAVQNQELARQAQGMARQIQEIGHEVQDLAASDAALLQAWIHLNETFNKLQLTVRDQSDLMIASVKQIHVSVHQIHASVNQIHKDQSQGVEATLMPLKGIQHSQSDAIEALTRLESLARGLGLDLSKLQAQAGEIQAAEIRAAEIHAAVQAGEIQAAEAVRRQSDEAIRGTAAAISGLGDQIKNVLENEVVRQVCVETGNYGMINPEVGLMCHLYSYLPSRRALDIGANAGHITAELLKTGYQVYAFEPCPPAFEKLAERVGSDSNFHPFPFALGSTEGDMTLHLATDLTATNTYGDPTQYSSLAPHSMPGELPFTGSIPVQVRTLAGLHASGEIPADIGLVKIDTEGFDLDVIQGMGEHRYPVVTAEFWDAAIPFGESGQRYTFELLVEEMRRRGYPWHIAIYRIWGQNQRGFYCGHPRSIPHSWGNLLFFRDHELFTEARKWCSAVLPQVFFKPATEAAAAPIAPGQENTGQRSPLSPAANN